MTPKQYRFVEEYAIDGNGAKAAIRAGYSVSGAAVTASRLLTKPNIKGEVERIREWHSTKSGITKDRVLREIAAMAFSNVSHYVVNQAGDLTLAPGAPRNAMAAVSSIKRKEWSDGAGGHTVEVEFKLWGKAEPIKLAGRHVELKGVADRVEHTGKDGGPIEYEDLSPEERRTKLKEILAAGAERVGAEPSADS